MRIIECEIEQFPALLDESEGKFVHIKGSDMETNRSLLVKMRETFMSLAVNFVVVGKEGEQLGFASVWPLKKTLAIGPIYVAENARGLGVAKFLLTHIIKYAGIADYDGVRTQTWSSNIATTTIFPKLGFEVRKIIPGERVDGSDTIQYILNF